MATLFISDLHLNAEQPDTVGLFLEFLSTRAVGAEALYILGDLFEAWLGDDVLLPGYGPVLEAMKRLSDSGTPIRVMHGNRDFLLGERFEQLSGASLIDDPTVISLYGVPTLLMHGDLLCSDDKPYQAMRAQLRDPQWIAAFLAKTPQERIAFAQELRERSRKETGEKTEAIMDVNADTVAHYLRQHQVQRLIHGHTHRPAAHRLELDGQDICRYVLHDWYGNGGGVLVCDEAGCVLQPIHKAA
jgi:UDP-2,3-diacylglucosamine hydrolase